MSGRLKIEDRGHPVAFGEDVIRGQLAVDDCRRETELVDVRALVESRLQPVPNRRVTRGNVSCGVAAVEPLAGVETKTYLRWVKDVVKPRQRGAKAAYETESDRAWM